MGVQIKNLPTTSEVRDDDWLIKQNEVSGTTNKISGDVLLNQIEEKVGEHQNFAPYDADHNYEQGAIVENPVNYTSLINNNQGNALTDTTKWKRGAKNSELFPQRFNLWDVSMSGTTITLTSTSDFDDYLFKSSQLVNGLELSFIPTQDGAGYGAGSSYTITIDGISKKLFENIDETLAGNGKCIKQGQPVKIYYNALADNGNGAFFIYKNSISDKNFIATLDNTNKIITLSGRNAEQKEYLNNLTASDLYVGFDFKFVPKADNVALTASQTYTLIINSNLSINLVINNFMGTPYYSPAGTIKANKSYGITITTAGTAGRVVFDTDTLYHNYNATNKQTTDIRRDGNGEQSIFGNNSISFLFPYVNNYYTALASTSYQSSSGQYHNEVTIQINITNSNETQKTTAYCIYQKRVGGGGSQQVNTYTSVFTKGLVDLSSLIL